MIIEKSGKLLLLIFLLLAGDTFACVCIPPKFAEKYTQSDFVAVAKIIKVYKNEGEEEIYKADILIRDLFKGENLKSIYIEGRSDGKKGSSCNIFIPENTELIIYATKKDDNQFSFGSCSGYLILSQDSIISKKTEKREIEMLNLLKAKNINFTNKNRYTKKKMSFSKDLEKFQGIQLNKSYAIFELTFTAGLSVKSINVISGFNNEIDNELIKIIEKSSWFNLNGKSENSITDNLPDESKILVGFYFYPAEKEYKSFVSEYDL